MPVPSVPVPSVPVPSGPVPPAGSPVLAPPPREPAFPLGRLVWSFILITVGFVGLADLAGAPIAASAYLAVPLAVVGIGMVVGAWYGHGRPLIAFGAVLSVALAVVGLSENADLGRGGNDVTWRPASIEQLDSSYRMGIGNAVLDLSSLDFTGRTEQVDVTLGVGDLTVLLPSDVDVQVRAQVDIGQATVFGQRWSGIGQSERDLSDAGADGPGGGELVIRATVDVGDLEVRR